MVFACAARRHILTGDLANAMSIYTMDVSESNMDSNRFVLLEILANEHVTFRCVRASFFQGWQSRMFSLCLKYQHVISCWKNSRLEFLPYTVHSSVSIIYLSNITTRRREAPNYRFKQTLVSGKYRLIHQCYIVSHSQSWFDVEWRSIESVTK